MIGGRIRAVFDRAQIVRALQDAFGEQKPGGELAIGARRAHDDRKRSVVQPDFERFFRCGSIAVDHSDTVPDPHNFHAAKRLGHEHIL